jgi:hypothetical protein
MKQVGNLISDPFSNLYWLVNQHPFHQYDTLPLTSDTEGPIMEDIMDTIQRIWEDANGENDDENSEPTSARKAEMLTVAAMYEAKNAKPRRIGYVDPMSSWSVKNALEEIKGMRSIPISEIKLGKENRHRPLFDDNLLQVLIRETVVLEKYRMFVEIEPESIFEIENSKETIKDLNDQKARIEEIKSELQTLQKDIDSARQGEDVLVTLSFDVPVGLFRWCPKLRLICPFNLKSIPISRWKPHLEIGTNLIDESRDDSGFPVLVFKSDLWTRCKGKVDYYAKSTDIPRMKANIEKDERRCDFLRRELNSLFQKSTSQTERLDERKKNLLIIDRAQKQILSAMNSTRREQMNEYGKLVMRLWNPSPDNPTGIRQVDDFLSALQEYRRFERGDMKPRPLTIGDISKLVSNAQEWLERNESMNT